MNHDRDQAKASPPISRVELLASNTERVLPVVVLLVAIFLRLHNLDTIPRGLLWDEAYNGLDALRVLAGERPVFFSGSTSVAAKPSSSISRLSASRYWVRLHLH